MCGIAGFERRNDDGEVARQLGQHLAQRGPDGAWFDPAGAWGLVQTRLAVVDLSDRVTYPLHNESGDLRLLFNGEIYEPETHRAALAARGHSFRTRCDAEVVLHAYEEWGVGAFSRLDGMFALALLHVPSGELLLTRDALGIKPLVHTVGSRFAFSSDAMALVAADLSAGEIELSEIPQYLALHYLPGSASGLRDVRQLPPGTILRRSPGEASRIERWRAVPFTAGAPAVPASVEGLGEALDRSVRRQLVADVPVGVFLSSGLDSALILESATRSGVNPVAFTIGFPGHGDYDEVAMAARAARHFGVEHITGELVGSFTEVLEDVTAAFDQPFADSSAIATLQLARLARPRVTVALSGSGGDDLFGGYYRHRAHLYAGLVGRLPAAIRRLLVALGGDRSAARASLGSQMRSYLSRFAALGGRDGRSQYLELIGSASSPYILDTVQPRLAEQASVDLERLARDLLGESWRSLPDLRSIQAFEMQTYLPGDILTKEDRATMALSLEARVPMLGKEVLEFAERISDRGKVSRLAGKRLLRQLGRRRLPRQITTGRKRGFAVPLGPLLAEDWRAESIEWFGDLSSELVDGRAAAVMLREDRVPASDIWALATLASWEGRVADARRAAARDSLSAQWT